MKLRRNPVCGLDASDRDLAIAERYSDTKYVEFGRFRQIRDMCPDDIGIRVPHYSAAKMKAADIGLS